MKSILFVFLAVFGLSSLVSGGLHAQTEATGATIAATLTDEDAGTTLLAALEAADLLSALEAEGSFVLLAPTNDAFAALPEGVLASLLEPKNAGALRELLLHHLVTDTGGASASSAADKLKDTNTTATKSLPCSNGTLYLIDQVLLPPDFDLSAL